MTEVWSNLTKVAAFLVSLILPGWEWCTKSYEYKPSACVPHHVTLSLEDPRRLRSLLSTPSLSPAPSHTYRHGYINALLIYHRGSVCTTVQQVPERNSSCHHHIRLRSSSSVMLSLEMSSNQNATDKKATVHWLFFQRS